MKPLADHIAPDTVNRLKRAAKDRFEEAIELEESRRNLASLYLCGYVTEMCLCAAFFARIGFAPNAPIERDTRQRQMAEARTPLANGEQLMSGDPHPLIGWARFLKWKRMSSPISKADTHRLNEAINKATLVYGHWRPELRYKVIDIPSDALTEVMRATRWFIDQCDRL